MNQLMSAPGDATSTPAGDLSVNLIYIGYGAGNHVYRVTVTRPGFTPMPVGDDDRPFGHRDQRTAQNLAEAYADSLIGYHTDSAAIRTEQDIIAGVTANLDHGRQQYIAPKQRDQAAVADIVADIKARPRNTAGFDQLVQGRPNQRRRTAPLSDAMRYALSHAKDGVIRIQPGITKPTLRSLAMGGLGDTDSEGGRPHDVTRIVLNARGVRMAEQIKSEVAA